MLTHLCVLQKAIDRGQIQRVNKRWLYLHTNGEFDSAKKEPGFFELVLQMVCMHTTAVHTLLLSQCSSRTLPRDRTHPNCSCHVRFSRGALS